MFEKFKAIISDLWDKAESKPGTPGKVAASVTLIFGAIITAIAACCIMGLFLIALVDHPGITGVLIMLFLAIGFFVSYTQYLKKK